MLYVIIVYITVKNLNIYILYVLSYTIYLGKDVF